MGLPVHKFLKWLEGCASAQKNYFTGPDKYFTENWHSIERQRKALSEEYTIISQESDVFVLQSKDKTYKTSVVRCSCPDFAENKEPCKHMYFVAHHTKVFNLKWGFKVSPENQQFVELLTNTPFKYNSIAKKSDNLYKLARLDIIHIKTISNGLMNITKESVIEAFPNLSDGLITKNKKEFFKTIVDTMPELSHDIITNWVFIDAPFEENPKYKSFRIRQNHPAKDTNKIYM